MTKEAWLSSNQQLLLAEFARLNAQIAGTDVSVPTREIQEVRSAMSAPAAIDVLADTFGLSEFERDVLLLCAGAQMDATMAAACQRFATDPPQATFGMALGRFATPHWNALTPIRPLRRWRLIEVKDEHALTTSRLDIDERVLHFLAGVNYLDVRLRPLIKVHEEAGLLSISQEALVAAALKAFAKRVDISVTVQLLGDDPAGKREVARRIARQLGLSLHVMNVADIRAGARDADSLAWLWTREAMLLGSALLLDGNDADDSTAARLAERLEGLVFIASRHAADVRGSEMRFVVNRPHPSEQKQLWIDALGEASYALNGSLDALASNFRLTSDTVQRAVETLRAQESTEREAAATLRQSCRESIRHRLADLAHRVEPSVNWNDLVLPDAIIATLRQIAAHVRQRLRVYDGWGFASKGARGLGVSVLFSGESGTGKTMAAEVLAQELDLDLYRIDVASMVSKYIGETEKNLRRVFDAAEESGAILLFDEADALFGKRSEVKDSHDRYANIEVSYLLQRMEVYRGLAILTTNLKGSLDIAFQRRLRFVVPFPFPDQSLRTRIWRGSFPPDAPLDRVDHAKLAQLNVAGGNIRNIALNAAFLAADCGESIGMNHLLAAARSEAAKRERPFSDAETRGWT